MNPLWLSFQLGLAFTAPSSPTETPTTVEVQALALEIPAIPADLHEAHAQYKTLRPLMAAQLQDLEGDLKRLYAQPGALSFHSGKMQIEAARKEEFQFLCSMLLDSESEAMEQEVLKVWQGWQNRLVQFGIASRQDEAVPISVADPHAREQVKALQEMKDRNQTFLGEINGLLAPSPSEPLHATNSPGSPSPEMIWLMAINGGTDARTGQPTVNWSAVREDLELLQSMEISHQKGTADTKLKKSVLPTLSLQWKPLAEHLNRCAKRLLEYERQAPIDESSDFKMLRLRAKIAFLERFRTVLWFDSLAWATITSSSPPKPLASIQSEVALGANIMREDLGNGSTTKLLPEVERVFLSADYWFPSLLPLRTNLKPLPEEKGFEKRPWPGVDGFIQDRVLPQSNPDLVAAFRRLARDAREFETVLRIFWREHPKVRLDLQYIPVSSRVSRMREIESSGSLLIKPIQRGFNLVVLVQQGLVDRGIDQVEPWLGQAIFTALIASRKGGVEAYENGLVFDADTMDQSWEFQRHLRLVLKRDHPEDYEVMLLEAQQRFLKGAW